MQHGNINGDDTRSLATIPLYVVVVVRLCGRSLSLLRQTLGGLTECTRQLWQIVAFVVIAGPLYPTSLVLVSIVVIRLVAVPDKPVALDTLYIAIACNIVKADQASIRVDNIIFGLNSSFFVAVWYCRQPVLLDIFGVEGYTLEESHAIDGYICAILTYLNAAITHRARAELCR